MTANAESRYQMLLHVAAPIRRRPDTAALNSTYTASVAMVDSTTPSASIGLIVGITVHLSLADGPTGPLHQILTRRPPGWSGSGGAACDRPAHAGRDLG